jgi:SAM-dependent methyltransferase
VADGPSLASRLRAPHLVPRLARRLRRSVVRRLTGWISFDSVPSETALRLAYEVMLNREPDEEGRRFFLSSFQSGALSRHELPLAIRGSEEFQNFARFTGRTLGFSIHAGRSQFVKTLPPARHIIDLGGTHLARPEGAFVWLGYPYPFEQLTIIDLHPDERHALYKADLNPERVDSPLGPVGYRYHSMTDLSSFADASVDLVYSGQSIEHVTTDDARVVLAEVARVLRPGGHLAIDTPNARVTRLQQPEFIDPDHKVEYTFPQLAKLLEVAGFDLVSAKGLNLARRSVEQGRFDLEEVSGYSGLYDALEDCYILCVVARKPG